MDAVSTFPATAAVDVECGDELSSLLRATPINLADALRSGIPRHEPIPGSGGLLYPGKHHLIAATRGHGKTMVSLILSGHIARHGGRVLYLDRENGPHEVVRRIGTIIDAEPALDEGYHDAFDYYSMPNLPRPSSIDGFTDHVAKYTLVVLDSYRAFLSMLDLDPDSERDVARFVDRYVASLQQRGVAVLILDNTGHNDRSRPKGSATKMDAAEVVYMLDRKTVLRADRSASVILKCTRSRFGDEGRAWTMDIGGGCYPLPTSDACGEGGGECSVITEVLAAASGDVRTVDIARLMRERGLRGKDQKLRELAARCADDPATRVGRRANGAYFLRPAPAAPVASIGARLSPDGDTGGQARSDSIQSSAPPGTVAVAPQGTQQPSAGSVSPCPLPEGGTRRTRVEAVMDDDEDVEAFTRDDEAWAIEVAARNADVHDYDW